MAEFILQPFRHRAGKLALDRRKEAITLTTQELLDKFGLDTSNQLDRLRIQNIRPGGFVGISIGKHSKKPVCFVLSNTDKSPSYEWILVKDPSFEDRIQEVFRVEKALWDAQVEEVA